MLHFLQVPLKLLSFLLKLSFHVGQVSVRGPVSLSLVGNRKRRQVVIAIIKKILMMFKKAN